MYDVIRNESRTATMFATIQIPGSPPREYRVPPQTSLPVGGPVRWHLWSLRWVEPRRGLMRFGADLKPVKRG